MNVRTNWTSTDDDADDAAPPRLPGAMAALPRDRHGRPIPWFAGEVDGVRDFRVIRPGGLREALKYNLCWVCGRTRGRHAAFVVGPMCAINRASSEPPCHLDCAVFSARVCPFLANPNMTRRHNGLPDGVTLPAGHTILRNPGVAMVWSSRTWRPVRAHHGQAGDLFDLGEPTAVRFYAHGRRATRTEVEHAINTGLPELQAMADAEGPRATAHLAKFVADARRLLPL